MCQEALEKLEIISLWLSDICIPYSWVNAKAEKINKKYFCTYKIDFIFRFHGLLQKNLWLHFAIKWGYIAQCPGELIISLQWHQDAPQPCLLY